MKIYLDNCCYNRPFDDQTQDRIHLESEAVLAVLKRRLQNKDIIIGSKVVELEIGNISNKEKKEKVLALYQIIDYSEQYTEAILKRAQEILRTSNIRRLDALHVASAESAKADVMLTTDDKLEKACNRLGLRLRVVNPLKYIMEVMQYE